MDILHLSRHRHAAPVNGAGIYTFPLQSVLMQSMLCDAGALAADPMLFGQAEHVRCCPGQLVGMAKSTAEHGATSGARAALSHSSARVLASQACSVAEPSIAQTTASVANWLAADTTGTPARGAAEKY